MIKGWRDRRAAPALPWHESIAAFKRDLIVRALVETRGNRTRAARVVRLRRTYLLQLIRELGVTAPRPGELASCLRVTNVSGRRSGATKDRAAGPKGGTGVRRC